MSSFGFSGSPGEWTVWGRATEEYHQAFRRRVGKRDLRFGFKSKILADDNMLVEPYIGLKPWVSAECYEHGVKLMLGDQAVNAEKDKEEGMFCCEQTVWGVTMKSKQSETYRFYTIQGKTGDTRQDPKRHLSRENNHSQTFKKKSFHQKHKKTINTYRGKPKQIRKHHSQKLSHSQVGLNNAAGHFGRSGHNGVALCGFLGPAVCGAAVLARIAGARYAVRVKWDFFLRFLYTTKLKSFVYS